MVVSVEPVVHDPDTTGADELTAVNAGTTTVVNDGAVYLYAVLETVLLPNTWERRK